MTFQQAISNRFVTAYYQLYMLQAVSSKAEYCRETGIIYNNFWSIEKRKRYATLENIALTVIKYNISPEWILLGEGDLFRKPKDKSIVNFTGILKKALDKYEFNKEFTPEKLTDENLEKCAYYYAEKIKKH